MPKRLRKPSGSEINIKGNVDTGGGDVAAGNIKKGDVYQTHGLQKSDLEKIFLPIYQSIEQKKNLPEEDREDLKLAVEEIKAEVGKEDEASEAFLERQLRNIARMAPDIVEVVLRTIASPTLGMTTLAQKIAEKANREKSETSKPVKKKPQ